MPICPSGCGRLQADPGCPAMPGGPVPPWCAVFPAAVRGGCSDRGAHSSCCPRALYSTPAESSSVTAFWASLQNISQNKRRAGGFQKVSVSSTLLPNISECSNDRKCAPRKPMDTLDEVHL